MSSGYKVRRPASPKALRRQAALEGDRNAVTGNSAGPAARSAKSVSGRGRSAPPGARSMTMRRLPPCMRRWTAGVTFIDTADVYGDGRSEKLIAKVVKERGGERPFIATKAGKRLPAQTVAGYTQENLDSWIDRSLKYLETDTLDLVQLHCPLTDLYYHPEVFERLDRLVEQRQDPQLRRQRRARRRSAEGHGISWRGQRPDHLQRVPPASRRSVLRPGEAKAGRHHRARAAGQRPAVRQIQARHAVRGHGPPQVQPQWRKIRCRRDLCRRAL